MGLVVCHLPIPRSMWGPVELQLWVEDSMFPVSAVVALLGDLEEPGVGLDSQHAEAILFAYGILQLPFVRGSMCMLVLSLARCRSFPRCLITSWVVNAHLQY